MSQNKTVIQGLEPAGGSQQGHYHTGDNSFYSRSGASSNRGTVVQGMMDISAQQAQQAEMQSTQRTIQPGKPIVGFLYSISRTPAGEYWPLQIGRNTIGQNPSSDIVLREGTVSTDHAVLIVRQVKNTGGVIAAVTDAQSTNGTMINGETIGFSAVECHNGDILTFGNNYELMLVLIDVAQMGLKVSKSFIPVEDDDDFVDIPMPGGATRPGDFSPYNDGPTAWGGTEQYRPTDGTVGLDGSVNVGNRGGTVPM